MEVWSNDGRCTLLNAKSQTIFAVHQPSLLLLVLIIDYPGFKVPSYPHQVVVFERSRH